MVSLLSEQNVARIFALGLAGLGVQFSSVAEAQDTLQSAINKTYLGASYHAFDYNDATLSGLSPTALRLQLGMQLTDSISLEAHYGVGLSEENTLDGGVPTQVEIDDYMAIYVKPELPINEVVKAYGLLGYAEAEVLKNPQLNNVGASFHEYGASYGVGAEFALTPEATLSVEYMRLLDEQALDASSFGLGLSMSF